MTNRVCLEMSEEDYDKICQIIDSDTRMLGYVRYLQAEDVPRMEHELTYMYRLRDALIDIVHKIVLANKKQREEENNND